MRTCNRCKVAKPADTEHFPVARKFPLGINYTCRPCDRERASAYQQANRDVNNRAGAKHRAQRMAEDPEAFRAYNAEKARRYRERNPDAVKASKRRHLKAHPEKNQEWVNRYRARKVAATIEPVDYAAIAERDKNVCHLCGFEVDLTVGTYHPMARTFDHVIPLSRGGDHSMSNIMVAHRLCNIRKNNRLLSVGGQEVG